jgi:cell division inhibitor SepF
MAGFLKRSAIYLGMSEADDDYDEEFTESERTSRSAAAPSWRATRASRPEDLRVVEPLQRESGHAVVDRTAGDRGAPQRVVAEPVPVRITTLQPRTYNEARTIGEHFRDGIPVIMNLTEMDDADAKRLVDFAAGLSFGLRGTLERVTNKVFLISPSNVSVSAEDKALIAEGGFFNQS